MMNPKKPTLSRPVIFILKIRILISIAGWALIAFGCYDFFHKFLIILNHPLDFDSFTSIVIVLARGFGIGIVGAIIVVTNWKIKVKSDSKTISRKNLEIIKAREY